MKVYMLAAYIGVLFIVLYISCIHILCIRRFGCLLFCRLQMLGCHAQKVLVFYYYEISIDGGDRNRESFER
jgi:hypothetical protein